VTVAYLALGSNLGDRARNLEAASKGLARHDVQVLRASSVRETEPFGVTDQPRFLNQVLEVEWEGTPEGLLRVAKDVEAEVGRTPSFRWGPREIDVDILLFGEQRVATPELTIPHPGLWQRDFVLQPLGELRPDILKE
jgi:2-amino-4-hydroxy-6-hydroxymethyldihydropteridine diphosphokinase